MERWILSTKIWPTQSRFPGFLVPNEENFKGPESDLENNKTAVKKI